MASPPDKIVIAPTNKTSSRMQHFLKIQKHIEKIYKYFKIF